MGLEKRGGQFYYYEKKREGNKVRSVYRASGEIAEMMAEVQEDRQREKEVDRLVKLAELEEVQAEQEEIEDELERALTFAQNLTCAALVTTGHHKHKGQWRKKRKNAN